MNSNKLIGYGINGDNINSYKDNNTISTKKQDYKQMRLSYSTDPMPIYEENQL
jgi:hypothetical protein